MGKNPRPKNNQKPSAKKIDPAITVAIIGLLGTVLTAIFASPVLIAWIQKTSPPTTTPIIINTIPVTPTLLTDLKNPEWNSILRLSIQNTQCEDPRLLPNTINPNDNNSLATQQFTQAWKSDEYLNWPLAPSGVDGRGELILNVSSVGDNKEWIKVANKLQVDVVAQKDIPEHVDVVGFSQCGATRERRIFDEIYLSTDFNEYKLNSTFAETDYFTLQPGEIEEFLLPFVCKTPGVYVLMASLSLEYLQIEYVTDSNQLFIFVCPQSFTFWKVDPTYPQFLLSETYQWNGVDYEEKP